MDIDLVYNYVNSNDIEWIERRNKYGKDNCNHECRFRDNYELRYSLRSVEKYAPWIHNIYIVMDSKVPEWLDVSNEKIHIIRHEEIMPKELLPCYNSNVIEFCIDNIPNLSEIFIYANDDMFLGGYVNEAFFVQNGKPIIRMNEHRLYPSCYYYRAICNSQKLFQKEFNVKYNLIPSHTMDVYSKRSIKECKERFSKDLYKIFKNRMRCDTDLHRVLYQYYHIINNDCILKVHFNPKSYFEILLRALKRIILPSKYLDYSFYSIHNFFKSWVRRLYFAREPKLLCLNDSELTTIQDIEKYHKYMDKKFGKICSYEIEDS